MRVKMHLSRRESARVYINISDVAGSSPNFRTARAPRMVGAAAGAADAMPAAPAPAASHGLVLSSWRRSKVRVVDAGRVVSPVSVCL